jgi:2-polyprenyl-6-methoxyphenol hydroxylase-like FAD-dependent oxidoreductase
MTNSVVIGAGIAGLGGALVCRALGHDVTVLERDPHDLPAAGPAAWERPGVPHAAQAHVFSALGIDLLRELVPDVYATLVSDGAVPLGPGSGTDPARSTLGIRRTAFEAVFRRRVLSRPGITLRSGLAATGLRLVRGGAARVTGVRLADGTTVDADLVVDAAGERSPVSGWLAAGGVAVVGDRVRPSHLRYYSRHYRMAAGVTPPPGFGVYRYPRYAAVIAPGDRGTVAIALVVDARDRRLVALRHDAVFTGAVRAVPLLAQYLQRTGAEPVGPVCAAHVPPSRLRGAATVAQAPVIGLAHLGDAAVVTDPLDGHGASLALAHAHHLGLTLQEHPSVEVQQVRALQAMTHDLLVPWLAGGDPDPQVRARIAAVSRAADPAGAPADLAEALEGQYEI